MMNKNEFANYIADNIKNYLPPEYSFAEIQIKEGVKNNDITLTGVEIRRPEEAIVPVIYVDGLYEKYVLGAELSTLVSEAASTRIEYDAGKITKSNPEADINDMLHDYTRAKEKIQVFLCNTERNQSRLRGAVRREVGEFSELYRLCIPFGDKEGSIAISPNMLKDWGISAEQLHEDAIIAENKREPFLATMHSVVDQLMFGSEPINILSEADPMQDFLMDNLYVLSTADKMNGAHMMLRDDILTKAGDFFGEDFYVLPSSVHEVLLVPMNTEMDSWELNEMVRSINGDDQVMNPMDILSDNAYSYDRGRHVLTNTRTGDSIDLRRDGKFIQNAPEPVPENKPYKPKKKQSR